MLTVAICEDDLICKEVEIALLENYLVEKDIYAEINTYTSPHDLLASSKKYDIYMLDIILNANINGIELGKKIKQIHPNSYIIFNSSESSYAAASYEADAYYYLVKPLDYEKISKVLNKLIPQIRKERLTINTPTGEHKVNIKDITYIDIVGRNPCYHFIDNFAITGITLRCSFEKTLQHIKDKPGFIFLSPNLFINIAEIKILNKDSLTFKNNETIYFPKTKYQAIREAWIKDV